MLLGGNAQRAGLYVLTSTSRRRSDRALSLAHSPSHSLAHSGVKAYAECGDQSLKLSSAGRRLFEEQTEDSGEFCNCDQQDPTCVQSFFAEGSTVPYEELVCDGPVALDGRGVCGEGKVRAVSILAMEQTHYLVFLLSIIHVVCGFVLYGLAWVRVRWEWGRWEKDHDVHRDSVNKVLEGYHSDLANTLHRRSMGASTGASNGGEGEGDGAIEIGRDKSIASCPSEFGPGGIDGDGDERIITRGVSFVDVSDVDGSPPRLERRSRTMPAILGGEEDGDRAFSGLRRTFTRSKSFHNLVSLERQLRHRIFMRTKTMTKSSLRVTGGWIHTLVQGLGPLIVSKSQYYKLRASFIYTHKLGGNFNFLQHVMVRERGTVLAVRSLASTPHSLAIAVAVAVAQRWLVCSPGVHGRRPSSPGRSDALVLGGC